MKLFLLNPDFSRPGREQECRDINECELFDEICANGQCQNQQGNFLCICNNGYTLDESGGNCTDINECEDSQSCLYGECSNEAGGFKCSCPPGFQLLDGGHGCVDRREGACYAHFHQPAGPAVCGRRLGEGVRQSACCCGAGKAWGPDCQPCPKPGSAEYKLVCPGGPGFQPNKETCILEDIDECTSSPDLCLHGRCSNTFGNFMCSCRTGYQLDNVTRQCLDINECSEGPELCNPGSCRNTDGGFQCQCPQGYMLSADGKTCVDMRKETCYMSLGGRSQCSTPMSHPQTRLICCCSMGAAWGNECSACPDKVEDFPNKYSNFYLFRAVQNTEPSVVVVDPVRLLTR